MGDLYQVGVLSFSLVIRTDLVYYLGVEETRYVLDRVHGIHGFFGASSMERLPAEIAIEQNARKFKDIEIGSR